MQKTERDASKISRFSGTDFATSMISASVIAPPGPTEGRQRAPFGSSSLRNRYGRPHRLTSTVHKACCMARARGASVMRHSVHEVSIFPGRSVQHRKFPPRVAEAACHAIPEATLIV